MRIKRETQLQQTSTKTPCWPNSKYPAFPPTENIHSTREYTAGKPIRYYFEERKNKKYEGRKRHTIATSINRDKTRTKLKYPILPLATQFR